MGALDGMKKKQTAAAAAEKEHSPSGEAVAAAAAAATTSASSMETTEVTAQASSSTNPSRKQKEAPPPTKKQRVEAPSQNMSDYSDLQAAVAKLSKSLTDNANDVEKDIDRVYAIITDLKRDGSVIKYKDKQHKNVSLLRVPVTTTDKSYQLFNDWVLSALDINGKGDIEGSSRRVMQQLIKNNEDAAHAALENAGLSVTKQMNETKLAAMFEDGNSNTTQQRKIMKHLRDHCGKEGVCVTWKSCNVLRRRNARKYWEN
jgi:hypothetical protein